MSNKLPTAEETLLKHARRRYAGDVAYTHGDSQVVIIGNVLAAIESHTAAHTAVLQDRIKELESENARYREVLETTYTALKDVVGQIPNDENLADWRLDFAEHAGSIAKEALKKKEQ